MYFKANLIIILVVINLMLLFFLLSKRENFFGKAAIIDTKKTIKVDSNLLIDSKEPKETIKKNADLFIDGDIKLGDDSNNIEPEICFGNKCYSSKTLKSFFKYKIPFEEFDKDPEKQEVPDRLCYKLSNDTGNNTEAFNCITGDDIKILNGNQPVFIAGPKDDETSNTFYEKDHIKFKMGPAPHYYYDINENHYERNDMKHKETLTRNFTHPDCIHKDKMYIDARGAWDEGDYHGTGVDEVPYFYNLEKLKGKSNGREGEGEALRQYNLRKDSADIDGKGDPDGILQMIKHPVHKNRNVDFDSDQANQHKGQEYSKWRDRCSWSRDVETPEDGELRGNPQDNAYAHTNFQLMNISAVNLMPTHFGPKSRDKVRYILRPGDETGMKCLTR